MGGRRAPYVAGLLGLAAATARAQPPTSAGDTLYGFVELDTLWDSTEGLSDAAGNAAIARPGTYAGDHGQTTFGARNSRLGYRIARSVSGDLQLTGQLEMDFLGNQPPAVSEAAFLQSPTFRLRHANLALDTPVVTIRLGQAWQLFGWQPLFLPNTVEIQGVPGEIFARAPQLRIDRTLRAGDVSLELAIAAARPPQRASSTPDLQAGLRLAYAGIEAIHTAGSVATSLDSAAVGASVVGRRFVVDDHDAAGTEQVVHGYGLSLDALIPIVPATAGDVANALTVTASYVTGAGIADLYTGLSGGVTPLATGDPPALDTGLVGRRADGSAAPVRWTSYVVGAQYYLPPRGAIWISAGHAQLRSSNARAFGAPTQVFDRADWTDGNVFVEVTPAVRLGVELARLHQTYVDGAEARSYRAQLSAWLIF